MHATVPRNCLRDYKYRRAAAGIRAILWPSMTTATKREASNRLRGLEVFGFLGLASLDIGVRQYWPGSMAASLVSYVFIGAMTIVFAVRVRAGYLRRRPYWTRESWRRYVQLTTMPLVALAVVLYVSSFDMSSNALGAPRSATRTVVAISMVVTMLVGAFGVVAAIDWLAKGEPSEQFTRTRWFQRRRATG